MPNFSNHVREAILHQNIIGWRQFLCGYISVKWHQANKKLASGSDTNRPSCGRILIQSAIHLHQSIWQNQNNAIKGITLAAQKQKERLALQHQA
jgi:hypothetical protein